MWSASLQAVMKNGSCAIDGCEPCQVGNQAALSSSVDAPRGCLFGAAWTKCVHDLLFDFWVYGRILRVILHCSRNLAERGGECASGIVQKVSTAEF